MERTELDRTSEVLRWTYGLVPIAAGADKFANLLTDWTEYLSPLATRVVPVRPRTFMRVVGVVEMAAGALVLGRKTARVGAYVVGGWLGAIALNLVAGRRHYDVAVRDLVMGIGAIALARLLEVRAAERKRAELPRQPVPMPARAPDQPGFVEQPRPS